MTNNKPSFASRLEEIALQMAKGVSWWGYPTSWETLDIDENRSLWASYTPDYKRNAPLIGDTTADLAIIGGGFTGVSAAYHFSKHYPEKRCVILEAKALANGASGRNGGMMLNWINGIEDESDAMTKRVYEFTNSGIDMITGLIEEHNLDVSYRRDGSMEVYTDPERAEKAHREAEHLNSIGIPIKFLTADDIKRHINLENVYGATVDMQEGQLNGAQYIRALKPVLEEQGVQIYEDTPVLTVNEGADIVLTTPQGQVRAKAIVLATNGYTGKLGYFRKGVFPLHSHVFATDALSDEQKAQVGWETLSGYSDDLDRISYSSMTREGHIVFGGGSNQSYAYLYNNKTAYRKNAESAFRKMQETQLEYLPTAKGLPISHRWTGTLAISLKRNCSIGVLRNRVFYGLGYSGHGVTLANLAGKVIVDIYGGNTVEAKQHEWYNQVFAPIPLEPFRWIGYQGFTRLTGRSPRT
ncbi:MAG: FAD-binding oxidoreductase [Chloroflexota bacterium]